MAIPLMVVVVLLVVLIVYLFFAIKNHKLRNQELSKELAETQADFDKKLKLQQKEAFLSAKEQLHSQREDLKTSTEKSEKDGQNYQNSKINCS